MGQLVLRYLGEVEGVRFVVLSSGDPLIVAGGGGGGGAPTKDYDVGDPGQSTGEGSQHGGSSGNGGKIREEGGSSPSFEAGRAGGGLTGDGESASISEGGKKFLKTAEKGEHHVPEEMVDLGEVVGDLRFLGREVDTPEVAFLRKQVKKTIAGGGGSLNNGIKSVIKEGANGGDGKVVITLIEPEL